jgi:hypothetical protein
LADRKQEKVHRKYAKTSCMCVYNLYIYSVFL